MKIKMLTTSCGPDPNFNFTEGQVCDVTVDEARYWHEAGVCTLLEPYPAEAEKAVVAPVQKAIVAPPETAKGKVSPAAEKASATPPASPDVQVSLTPPAGWGKGEGK